MADTTVSVPVTAAIFPSFSSLPLEIRRKIWQLAASDRQPKIIHIQPQRAQIPVLLQACCESRKVVLPHFVAFSALSNSGSSTTCYFEPEKDIFYLNKRVKFLQMLQTPQPTNLHAAIIFVPQLLARVRTLVLNLEAAHKLTSASRGGNHDMWAMLEHACPELRNVVFVINGTETQVTHTLRDFLGAGFATTKNLTLMRYAVDSLKAAQSTGRLEKLNLLAGVMGRSGVDGAGTGGSSISDLDALIRTS